jgi:hypothetical protein
MGRIKTPAGQPSHSSRPPFWERSPAPAPVTARAGLTLETRTARLLRPGYFEIGTAVEFQTAPNGQEFAFPIASEPGLTGVTFPF